MTIKREKIQGPVSGAGILRFFDVAGGGKRIPVRVVVGGVIAFLIFEIVLNVIM